MRSTDTRPWTAVATATAIALSLAGCNDAQESGGMAAETSPPASSGEGNVAVSKVDSAESLADLLTESDAVVQATVTSTEDLSVNGVDFVRAEMRVQRSSDPTLRGTTIHVRQTDFGNPAPENMPRLMERGKPYLLALQDFQGPQEVDDEYVITFDEGIWDVGSGAPKNIATQDGAPIPELDITEKQAQELTAPE